MKKLFPLIIAGVMIASAVFVSCKKSDDAKEEDKTPAYTCTTCNTAPEAKAEHDNSSKGIYKGSVTGSSGTIKFDVGNNGSAIAAVMVIDGITVNLTSSVAWVEGQPYVAPFTGMLNGQVVSITFSVQLNGGAPDITSADIPGHPNASFILVKETSTALIEVFEGTYNSTKPEIGTFNLILSRTLKLWGADAREDGSTDVNSVDGTINDNGELVSSDNGVIIGKLNGDNLTGTFTDSGNRTINITGKRTL
jgi:hypothetical protein